MTISPADFVDFEGVPFTVKDSRFLVAKHDDQLAIYYVRYEAPLAQCAIHILPSYEKDSLDIGYGTLRTDHWELAILGEEVRFWDLTAARPLVFRGDDAAPSELSDDEFKESAESNVVQWMNLMPPVPKRRRPMATQCWWVLGVNQIPLRLKSGKTVTAAVPSKIGYVGVWQWDAYFIALGLRHGSPEIALEQLDVVFSPTKDGQLPDVVHEDGILSSSEDLPPADLKTLQKKGRCDVNAVVPLTKPPLAAWAALKVLESIDPNTAEAAWQRWKPIITRSQDWWLRRGNEASPRYEHAYSSGLDDSPIFDNGGAVTSPDLIAYLLHQHRLLYGNNPSPELNFLSQQLQSLWNEAAKTFLARNEDGDWIPSRTILSLIGAFSGDISSEQLTALHDDILNPQRFEAAFPLPTVSQDDPNFSVDEMWRGPTWINTNYLVAESMERCGEHDLAAILREKTLNAIEAAEGPVEYLNCRDGKKAPGATTCFGWSAALYIDLAVQEVK